MSAELVLVVIGALLKKLWLSTTFCCMILCFFLQRLNLVHYVSMRLRPKRTCSGVVCFGTFHIKQFSFIFLFLRGGLT
ncbi:hypothetical protein TorRG33x02_081700 [Trema orientale]|uniref:Uncharacterized protein n=1 Tax=Trema orientale TaxID=63057 RepID=A0A2P5FDQ4_TREOI|nr:hypothetical protein TorRG33x02_081700 [Trema orientale]